MFPRRELFLFSFILLVSLFPLATAHELLPADLLLIATDDYTEEVQVGGNTSFTWTLVNVGNTTRAITFDPVPIAEDYGLTVEPRSAVLTPGSNTTVFANVTVPGNLRGPQASIEITVSLSDGRHGHLRATVIAAPAVRLVDVITAFLAIGGIIFIGFFASLVFERTKVPDLLFLIFLGLLLGPILATFFGITLVPLSILKIATPYFAAVALMIILFDGGLNLNISRVLRRAGISVLHTLLTWLGSVLVITTVAMFVLGYPLWIGVLLGTILGGTSGAVVINLVRKMSISEDTRTILVLESTITDVLCVIGALTVIGILRGGGTLAEAVGDLALAFLVALATGGLAGVIWLRVLSGMQGKPFGFMITIAALFLLYAGTEALGGSGGMAALTFGLVLGNHPQIGRILRPKSALRVDAHVKQFHSELSFGVRTFFFVFLGFSFTFPFVADWNVVSPLPFVELLNNTFMLFLLATLLIFLGVYIVRVGAAAVTTRLHVQSRPDRRAIVAMMGRGLAAAVLASFPFAIPAFTDPGVPEYAIYYPAMARFEIQFLTITFLIILMTVVATGIGVVVLERRKARAGVPVVPASLPSLAEWEMVLAEIDDFDTDGRT